jgi:5-methyltetrahydrofolate--homocysteine methyltransferase
MTTTLEKIGERLHAGDAPGVKQLTQEALDEGLSAGDILNQGLMPGMQKVGTEFRDGILFVPEVLVAARAMHAGIDVLKPLLTAGEVASRGKAVIGTVKGDLHDVGKNLVGVMLQGGGFEVVDLGVDVSAQKFVDAVKAQQPRVVGLSALLTTTMQQMKGTIEALRAAGLRDGVKVLVGGAPVTQAFADEIGADGYADDGASAVELASSLVA